tara:strand:- start:13990 stop:14937 length:948 start_codon:yes stop_codon:yes gene_type:complete
MKVYIAPYPFGEFDETLLYDLTKEGFDIRLNSYIRKATGDEILKDIPEDTEVYIAGTEKISSSLYEKCCRLKAIIRLGVGLDNIDFGLTKDKNVLVTYTPNSPALSVAEHAVSLMSAAIKKIPYLHSQTVQGVWKKEFTRLIYRSKIGIVGFGRIGQLIAKFLMPYNPTLKIYDPIIRANDEIVFNAQHTSLDALLEESDVIFLAAASSQKPIISHKEVALLKNNVVIVNSARGTLVNEQLIEKFLTSNPNAVYATDVFCNEPYGGPLCQLKNVVLTPHVGSSSLETRIMMEREVAEELRSFKLTGTFKNKVKST